MNLPSWLEEDRELFDASGDFDPAPLSGMPQAVREECWATMALRHCKGLGVRSVIRLLRLFGSARAACQEVGQWAPHVSGMVIREFRSESWRKAATREWENALKSDARLLLWKSSLYPFLLRQLPDAPALLYVRGDITLLRGATVAVVGSRTPSTMGLQLADSMARELSAAGVTVVSGLALGIDQAAHRAALEGAGRSIGVLGTGVDIVYPLANTDIFHDMAQSGLLVSEFPLKTPPSAVNFPIRNRIISGLSLGVLVVEAAARSGSLVTAAQALEQNREVFAIAGVPMDSHSVGCQNLIRRGAIPVFCAEDILRDLLPQLEQYTTAPKPAPPLRAPLLPPPPAHMPPPPDKAPPPQVETGTLLEGDMSTTVLNCLRSSGPLQMDRLSDLTSFSPSQLASTLLGLELTGQVELLPGSFYKAL